MPQLDKVHFFSQFFWLCVFYFGFYFLIAKHFLPRMARILQYRKNKFTKDSLGVAGQELGVVKESAHTVLENVFSASNKFWSQRSARLQEWYKTNVQFLNGEYLKGANNLYLQKVGDYSLVESTALAGASRGKPMGCYAWFFIHRFKERGTDNLVGTTRTSHSVITGGKPTTKKSIQGVNQLGKQNPVVEGKPSSRSTVPFAENKKAAKKHKK